MVNTTSQSNKQLWLSGTTCVHIDWANVYGWRHHLRQRITPRRIQKLLGLWSQVKDIHFYFGTDHHPKSVVFLERVKKLGFVIHTKPVKYITVKHQPEVVVRKCDFDVEITLETLKVIDQFTHFIFLSGDGDFAPLYSYLISLQKRVTIIFGEGSLGREVWQLQSSIQLVNVERIKNPSVI